MTTPRARQDGKLESRLSSLEAQYEGLKKEMHGVRLDIRALTESVTAQQRTPWSTLASWAAVIISVVALGGSGYVRDIERIERDAKEGDARLDTGLQREMRLLDARTQAELDALKEGLAEVEDRVHEHQSNGHPRSVVTEMRLREDALARRIDAVERRLETRGQ